VEAARGDTWDAAAEQGDLEAEALAALMWVQALPEGTPPCTRPRFHKTGPSAQAPSGRQKTMLRTWPSAALSG